MSIAGWDEATLERFVQDRVESAPVIVGLLAARNRIATYLTATRPTVSAPTVIYVSDAAAGSRFQGWDVTAGAWVPLG